MKCVVYVFILALSACLTVVWWSACPDNAEKGVEQNCDATMTVDGKFTSKSRTESASAESRVMTRPPQMVKAAENVQPVLQSSSPSVESAISMWQQLLTLVFPGYVGHLHRRDDGVFPRRRRSADAPHDAPYRVRLRLLRMERSARHSNKRQRICGTICV